MFSKTYYVSIMKYNENNFNFTPANLYYRLYIKIETNNKI